MYGHALMLAPLLEGLSGPREVHVWTRTDAAQLLEGLSGLREVHVWTHTDAASTMSEGLSGPRRQKLGLLTHR